METIDMISKYRIWKATAIIAGASLTAALAQNVASGRREILLQTNACQLI